MLNHPGGIVYDPSNDNFLFADSSNYRIRRVTRAGVVTTVAGSGALGSADGSGTAASFDKPRYIAVAPGPLFYIAEWAGCRIRRMTPGGAVTTVFSAACGSAGGFTGPTGIVWHPPTSLLYVADYMDCSIKSLTLNGTLTVVAGAAGSCSYASGALLTARFNSPHGLDIGSRGQLLLADRGNHVVREISLASNSVTVLAGSIGTSGTVDGTGSAAVLTGPMDVHLVSPGQGNSSGYYLLSTDFDTARVRKVV